MANLRNQSAATVEELRSFLEGMRGKSAKEVLGTLAESGLIRATFQATVISIVGIGLFTVGPYMIYGGKKKGPTTSAAAPAAATANAGASTNSPTATTSAMPTSGAAATTSNNAEKASGGATPETDLDKAAKALGVSETKSADPKNNPREKDLDNLLDKVK